MAPADAFTIETPAGSVHATAGSRRTDCVVFALSGAVRGSVHVTGTQHPQHWDQFNAVRACLGPVDAFEDTAPDDDLPRLARGRTRYRGSLTRCPGRQGRPAEVSVNQLWTAAGDEPTAKAAAALTAVLSGCAEAVAQRADLPLILDAARLRKTPGLLRFLHGAAAQADAEADRLRAAARAALPAQKALVAAWWTVARWFTAHPHPVLLLMLAEGPGSLVWQIDLLQWRAVYCATAAADERGRARKFRAEVASLLAQQRRGRRRAAPDGSTETEEVV
ncbi:hypothetical protein [Streptomyces sp. NPDC094468]|uniref:hypothetical protein n=1 Tax=Streptomyces sp. NPDC094468 TaxID=3366066 RepID=UPI0037F513D6